MALDDLFEAKKRLYPQSAKGRFRKLKWLLNTIFLSIYCLSPFLRFDRGPSASSQAILIDIPNSRLYFFFIEIWPQEVYYLAGILILAAVILFFVTSLFGRVWCGYACFQTVWNDIFYAVEKLFQGDRNARILLDRKNSFEKFYKKFLTHATWILISLITGFAFVCYFNDAFTLTKNLIHGKISLNVLWWILGITGSTYIMAGFAREHVCTFMCPYARFQSAMFDRDTLIITDDEKRGEPRGKLTQNDPRRKKLSPLAIKNSTAQISQSLAETRVNGDCIDCKQCVVVCPQGIDIREGLQMECIACGLCVDACDEVMDKIGLPRGLIRYDTEAHLQEPGKANKFRIFKPRTFYYATIILAVSFIMLHSLIVKPMLDVSAIPDRNPLFVKLSDGSIRNGYTLKISNKTHSDKIFSFKLLQPQEAEIKVQSYEEVSAEHLPVQAEETRSFKIYVSLPPEFLEKMTQENILLSGAVIDESSLEEHKIEMVFVGK